MPTKFRTENARNNEMWFSDVDNTENILSTFGNDPKAVYLACLVVGQACADYQAEFSEIVFVEFYRYTNKIQNNSGHDYLITIRYNGYNCASYGGNGELAKISVYAD